MTSNILPRNVLNFVESYITEIGVSPDGYLCLEQYNPNMNVEVGGEITQTVKLSREQFQALLANADVFFEQFDFGGNQ